ncbi:ribosome hibernation-promoting factor, HPF/YfiA family [Brumicola nitratireducens]|jgi:ribosomal subunit interface protein|uniref:Ribosomal subunit interface protein n=1 Tax=Glaciecola nitratireducens (strain JCM 12485 / KCTC 12276 / FR1064) TaxID=1085623 RepID=G4QF52_GLANF|nr:ribosome-associated translation inhibitor RaiA [Glaciecola nitratireducens]AEP28396.1 ribosomal subunit interface protein [Glaciecola nitratireducens FR1064]
MKINVSGHHCDISESLKEDIEQKFEKIANHFPTLIALDIFVTKEHGEYSVELATKYEGTSIAVKGKNDVMYPAIFQARKKLDAALKHRKGQLKSDLHEKPTVTTPEIAHEIIQDMDLK